MAAAVLGVVSCDMAIVVETLVEGKSGKRRRREEGGGDERSCV